jgi:hypothetical protein
MHLCNGAVYHRLIQIGDFFSFLSLFLTNHVVLVKELNVVIFQGVCSFVFLCGM